MQFYYIKSNILLIKHIILLLSNKNYEIFKKYRDC